MGYTNISWVTVGYARFQLGYNGLHKYLLGSDGLGEVFTWLKWVTLTSLGLRWVTRGFN